MNLLIDDLFCPTCRGYVHPFLERCPACGTGRQSRIEDARTHGALGAATLAEDEDLRNGIRAAVLRYAIGMTTTTLTFDLAEGISIVGSSLPYRAAVAADGSTPGVPSGPMAVDHATLSLARGSLSMRVRPSGQALAELPVASIMAVTPTRRGSPAPAAWSGVLVDGRAILASRLLLEGDLLVTFGVAGVAGQLALGNRSGLLTPKARPDHYELLARWLGILAAIAAENRWTDVGIDYYLAELGLGAPSVRDEVAPAAGGDAAPAARAGDLAAAVHASATDADGTLRTADTSRGEPGRAAPATPAGSVRAAIEELEALHVAGLVSEEEYAAKRREILARL